MAICQTKALIGTVTVVAQWAKAPGIHYYVAGSIPAVTPRYCTENIEKCSLEHKKKQRKKKLIGTRRTSGKCGTVTTFE